MSLTNICQFNFIQKSSKCRQLKIVWQALNLCSSQLVHSLRKAGNLKQIIISERSRPNSNLKGFKTLKHLNKQMQKEYDHFKSKYILMLQTQDSNSLIAFCSFHSQIKIPLLDTSQDQLRTKMALCEVNAPDKLLPLQLENTEILINLF